MIESMSGSTRPYQYDREIAVRGGQQQSNTLVQAKALLIQEIAQKLPYPCVKCNATGLTNGGTKVCDNCKGWTATAIAQTNSAPITLTPVAPIPNETL